MSPSPTSGLARTVRAMETRETPCASCGATVHMLTNERPRRLGETAPRTFQYAKCSNPKCETNPEPGTRRIGTPHP